MFINSSTSRAGARGISGVNQFNQNSRQPSFILDKLAKLVKCPGVMLPPLSFPNRDAVSYPLKVFQGNAPTAAFSPGNNTLADYVVDVSDKAPLFPGALLKKSFRCLSIFGLKFGAKFGMSLSQPVDLATGVNNAVRVSRKIDDTEVNPQKLVRVSFRRLLRLTGLEKIEAAISINKVGLTRKILKKRQMPVTGDKGNPQPSIESPDRNKLAGCLPGEDAFIISDATMPVEYSFGRAASLVGVGHLCQNPDHNLGSEVEPVSKVVVEQVVQVILAKCLCLPSLLAYVVGSIVYAFQRAQQYLVLLFGRCQFNLRYQFTNIL